MLGMRSAMLVLAALGAMAGAVPAAAQPRPIAPGTQVEWSADKAPRPVTYRSGDLMIEVRPLRDGENAAPQVTVSGPGFRPVTITGSSIWSSATHRIGAGRLDPRGRRYVELQSFSGGAHCCNEVQLVVIGQEGARRLELGAWDGEPGDAPRDVDGDGFTDFVQRDDRFLYAFASYAGSLAPPQILNVVDGRVVDVSARAGFRPLFVEAVNFARPYCLGRDAQGEPNGACAAYVAAAARIGQFDAAWAKMLRTYDRRSDWEYPTGCRLPLRSGECPRGATIRYRGYPDALRAFLVRSGYIAR
ncbi:hypothetical protein ACFQ1E_06940 [Sphingomonas canadensis]|uniref:VCBS repeat-containing protein n=1 Tax=Sphingomonas canadensis TaxID=1219257 RepID=A0ABW3H5D8_9SPHN|nr:hypothetical protein [Sphingomonas canadensis]MCW3835476.1 hypothetical protein [Sphingomonas canadensis]